MGVYLFPFTSATNLHFFLGVFLHFITGDDTKASGQCAHAEGSATEARGESSHAGGIATIAAANAQTTIGVYNVESTKETDKLIIGKGFSGAQANCFRVTHTGVYASGSHNSSGADYAELFEWLDGNPDKKIGRGGLLRLTENISV